MVRSFCFCFFSIVRWKVFGKSLNRSLRKVSLCVSLNKDKLTWVADIFVFRSLKDSVHLIATHALVHFWIYLISTP